MQIHTGKLHYNQFGDYELHFAENGTEGIINLTKLLDQVYYSDNNRINITITKSTPEGLKTLFREDGNLLRKRDTYGIYNYHINGESLEDKLFNNTNEYLEITLIAESLKGENYDTRKQLIS